MALSDERYAELNELCRRFRIDVLTAIHAAQSGHPGGSLSCCEILTYLYQEHMNIDANDAHNPDRDRLVLSKGHAAPMLYRNLAEKGFFPVSEMATLRRMGGLAAKWEAFGWTVLECDGHDLEALDFCVSVADGAVGAPTVIIANTIKGKGVSFMEGKNTWHGKAIDDESFAKAMEELGGAANV